MKDYKGLKWETFSVWGHVWDYKGLKWEKFSVWGHV